MIKTWQAVRWFLVRCLVGDSGCILNVRIEHGTALFKIIAVTPFAHSYINNLHLIPSDQNGKPATPVIKGSRNGHSVH